ncbi:MAG: acetate--CoA ligase family protein, partial [Anaerolineales bacterium]|nr:acetate--CoA ligase family protein [Anaerolineales bacterium]
QLVTMSHMLDVLDNKYPGLPTYGGISLSGGENTIAADISDRLGLQLPPFQEETRAEIVRHTPDFSTPHNPCDATTALFYNTDAIMGVVGAVASDPQIGSVFLGLAIRPEKNPLIEHLCHSVAEAKAKVCPKPLFAIPRNEETHNAELRAVLEDAGVPLMSAPMTSFKCLRYLADFVSYDPSNKSLQPAVPNGDVKRLTVKALSEFDSKNEIARYGVPIPGQRVVHSVEDLKEAASNMVFPIVLKINSPDILHKSDVGGVKLNVASVSEALDAYIGILNSVLTARPDAQLDGVLVQEMAPEGLEMIIGVKSDAQFGPLLLVGLGGVFVEIFRDTAIYPAPLNKTEALNMLQQLKSYKLLTGYRGSKPRDIDALAELMVKISDYAYENKEHLKEMDLNPVFVYEKGEGVSVADAVIVRYA